MVFMERLGSSFIVASLPIGFGSTSVKWTPPDTYSQFWCRCQRFFAAYTCSIRMSFSFGLCKFFGDLVPLLQDGERDFMMVDHEPYCPELRSRSSGVSSSSGSVTSFVVHASSHTSVLYIPCGIASGIRHAFQNTSPPFFLVTVILLRTVPRHGISQSFDGRLNSLGGRACSNPSCTPLEQPRETHHCRVRQHTKDSW